MTGTVADIIAYHERTKHQPDRYASGPHGLDWATQPNSFRRFTGAPLFRVTPRGRPPVEAPTAHRAWWWSARRDTTPA